jgi:pyocin large subunit-like protein
MSVSGQTVLSVQVSVGGSLAWDVSALPAGAYLLKVVSPNAWTIRKVMIGSR